MNIFAEMKLSSNNCYAGLSFVFVSLGLGAAHRGIVRSGGVDSEQNIIYTRIVFDKYYYKKHKFRKQ